MPRESQTSSIIDLFSGVGGLTLGATRAGFTAAAAAELDKIAIHSHQINFPRALHLNNDVSTLSGNALLAAAGLKVGELAGLIGGPPCQGFSLIGKRQADDPRNQLFSHFFRLVAETKPRFFVAENVPGILTPNNAQLIEAAMSALPNSYTVLKPFKVNASRFGAATTRTRVFFVGFQKKYIDELTEESFFASCQAGPTVQEALRGLPTIRSSWGTEEQSWRKIQELPQSDFFSRLKGHIPTGIGDEKALERLNFLNEVSGCFGTVHTEETIRRLKKLSQGETDPVSRAPRLKLDGYCPTLRAGTASDKGSFQAVRPIHPTAHRVITPREAARLQGFPDWFQFHPTKWHSFRQIGNSVSPIVAEAILKTIASAGALT
jgi:DNA (cytosine-5)-methyltransferase 1